MDGAPLPEVIDLTQSPIRASSPQMSLSSYFDVSVGRHTPGGLRATFSPNDPQEPIEERRREDTPPVSASQPLSLHCTDHSNAHTSADHLDLTRRRCATAASSCLSYYDGKRKRSSDESLSASCSSKRVRFGGSQPLVQVLLVGLDGRTTVVRDFEPGRLASMRTDTLLETYFAPSVKLTREQTSGLFVTWHGKPLARDRSLNDYGVAPRREDLASTAPLEPVTVILHVCGRVETTDCDREVVRAIDAALARGSSPTPAAVTRINETLRRLLMFAPNDTYAIDLYVDHCGVLLSSNHWSLVHAGLTALNDACGRHLSLARCQAGLGVTLRDALERFFHEGHGLDKLMTPITHEATIAHGDIVDPLRDARNATDEAPTEGKESEEKEDDCEPLTHVADPRVMLDAHFGAFDSVSFDDLEQAWQSDLTDGVSSDEDAHTTDTARNDEIPVAQAARPDPTHLVRSNAMMDHAMSHLPSPMPPPGVMGTWLPMMQLPSSHWGAPALIWPPISPSFSPLDVGTSSSPPPPPSQPSQIILSPPTRPQRHPTSHIELSPPSRPQRDPTSNIELMLRSQEQLPTSYPLTHYGRPAHMRMHSTHMHMHAGAQHARQHDSSPRGFSMLDELVHREMREMGGPWVPPSPHILFSTHPRPSGATSSSSSIPPPPSARSACAMNLFCTVTVSAISNAVTRLSEWISLEPALCIRYLARVLARLHQQLQRVSTPADLPPVLLTALRTLAIGFDNSYQRHMMTSEAPFMSEQHRMDIFLMLLRCIDAPAAALSATIVQDLGLLLRPFTEFSFSHPIHFASRMLPPDASPEDVRDAFHFMPMISSVFGDAPHMRAHIAAKAEARALARKHTHGSTEYRAQRVPQLVHLFVTPVSDLTPSERCHLLRRLFYFSLSPHDLSKESRKGLLATIYCAMQLGGFETFAFAESLLHTHMRAMIELDCQPLVELIRQRVTTQAPVQICASVPTQASSSNGAGASAIACSSVVDLVPSESSPVSESEDDRATWKRDVALFHSWLPVSSRSATLDSSHALSLACVTALKSALQVLRTGTGPKVAVHANRRVGLHKRRRKFERVIRYMSAWKEVYSEIERRKQVRVKAARDASQPCSMEVDGESSASATAVPSSTVVPPPHLLRLSHHFDADPQELLDCAASTTSAPPTGAHISKWLPNFLAATETRSTAVVADSDSVVSSLTRMLRSLSASLTAILTHAAFELRLTEHASYVIGKSSLRCLMSPCIKAVPAVLSMTLPLLTLMAIGEPLFPDIQHAMNAWRDLVEDNSQLLNLLVAQDATVLDTQLQFLTCSAFRRRETPEAAAAAVEAKRSERNGSLSTSRSPVSPPHLLKYLVREHYLTATMPRIATGAGFQHRNYVVVNVNRQAVLADAFDQLRGVPASVLRSSAVSIHFKNEPGTGPGVVREFILSVCRELLDPNYGLFVPTQADPTVFTPSTTSAVHSQHIAYFTFAGRMFALALMGRVKMEAGLAPACMQYIMGQPIDWRTHFRTFDPQMCASFDSLLSTPGVDAYQLNFTASVQGVGMQAQDVELVPGGRLIAVTDDNKDKYVQRYAEFRMVGSVKHQLDAFKKGFSELIPLSKLSLLSSVEVQLYLCGLPELDVLDWRRHTSYRGFTDASPVIQWFWEIVGEMTQLQRANLLFFACSMSRVPAGGFAALSKGVDGGFRISHALPPSPATSPDALFPTSHTCFMELCLPGYSSRACLREKLDAICQERAQAEGFGLI